MPSSKASVPTTMSTAPQQTTTRARARRLNQFRLSSTPYMLFNETVKAARAVEAAHAVNTIPNDRNPGRSRSVISRTYSSTSSLAYSGATVWSIAVIRSNTASPPNRLVSARITSKRGKVERKRKYAIFAASPTTSSSIASRAVRVTISPSLAFMPLAGRASAPWCHPGGEGRAPGPPAP
jgi:hypothetical protein